MAGAVCSISSSLSLALQSRHIPSSLLDAVSIGLVVGVGAGVGAGCACTEGTGDEDLLPGPTAKPPNNTHSRINSSRLISDFIFCLFFLLFRHKWFTLMLIESVFQLLKRNVFICE